MADEEKDPDAEKVARTLAAIPLGQWVAFVKMAAPAVALLVPTIGYPAKSYLDGRDSALRASIISELSVEDEHARVEALRVALDRLEGEVEDIGAEIDGARAVRQAIAERIGDTRERLVRVEALAGVD